jgi:uncharacterized membrane protein
MDLRLALYELAAAHRLDGATLRRLLGLAGLEGGEPAALPGQAARGTMVLGAAMVGLGVIFWIAAHWDTLGRLGQFALLQALVGLLCAGAMLRPALGAPLGLLALLGIGGLFAYFGQTYQTGADPWQLFALWGGLTLPLALAVRSDAVWAPWALVALTAASLWVHAHTGHRWRVEPQDLPVHLAGWSAALLLVAGLAPPLRRYSGAGLWSLRTAITLAVLTITATAMGGLLQAEIAPHYGLGLLLLAVAMAALALPRSFDLYGLSATALGLNALLVAGLARQMFQHFRGGDATGRLLLIGLAAAGLLAATVTGVLRLARHRAAAGEGA